MAGAYPRSVCAVQVGSYFVRQYYQVLRQQLDLVHQFYSDANSMMRVDGDSEEFASSMVEREGRSRSSYQMDAPRGHFGGQSMGRGSSRF